MERNDLRESSEEDAALNELPRTDIYIYMYVCVLWNQSILSSAIYAVRLHLIVDVNYCVSTGLPDRENRGIDII